MIGYVLRGRFALERAADFKAGHARKHQIKNNECRLGAARLLQSGRAIRRRYDSIRVALAKMDGEQIDHITLIFDDQDGFSGVPDSASTWT